MDQQEFFCDNQGVVKNISIPSFTLAKKHNLINYHTIWEAVAADIMMIFKEDTEFGWLIYQGFIKEEEKQVVIFYCLWTAVLFKRQWCWSRSSKGTSFEKAKTVLGFQLDKS